MKRNVLLAALALVMPACLGSEPGDSLQGSWQLTSGTVNGDQIPIVPDHPITITFDGETVGGTASCNSYGGSFELSGSSVTFGNLAMTEMACLPEETMRAEAMYAAALMRVDTVVVDDGLTLAGPGVDLVFATLPPVPDAKLTNTVWVLEGLVGDDAVTSVSGARATVEFFSDGSVLGSTGCRSLTGHYVISGAELVMTDLSAQGECEPDLMDQDNHVISVLEGTVTVEIDGGSLTITAAGGEGLVYASEE